MASDMRAVVQEERDFMDDKLQQGLEPTPIQLGDFLRRLTERTAPLAATASPAACGELRDGLYSCGWDVGGNVSVGDAPPQVTPPLPFPPARFPAAQWRWRWRRLFLFLFGR
jgi:hypothetical protein